MKFYLSILFILTTLVTNAQQAKYHWFLNQLEVKKFAKEHNANILMVFAGSDWCRPCIQFKKDVLESKEFTAYADDHIVVLYLDFPSKKKNKLSKEATTHNEELAEKYNLSGTFPKIILFDKDMIKIKEIKFEGQSPTQFITQLQ